MMVLIDRKFNEEQLLIEIFFPKMHTELDICKKVISWGLKRHKKAPGGVPADTVDFYQIFLHIKQIICPSESQPHIKKQEKIVSIRCSKSIEIIDTKFFWYLPSLIHLPALCVVHLHVISFVVIYVSLCCVYVTMSCLTMLGKTFLLN